MKYAKNSQGFTLFELILIIAIVFLITLLPASFYSRFFAQNEVQNTTDALIHSFRKAQIYSMMGKKNSSWGVSFATHTITLYQGASFASRNQALDETFTLNPNLGLIGFSDINFSKVSGLPNQTATITISQAANSKTITVNDQGVVERTN